MRMRRKAFLCLRYPSTYLIIFLRQDLPRVGSHEFAGVVEALGPDVDSSLGLKEGMLVGVPGRFVIP